MRWLSLLLGLTICASAAQAQEQERKLIDRLLRPNLALRNSAQDKKFAGTGTSAVEKKFTVKEFDTGQERAAKSYAGTKDFSAGQFETKKFTRAEMAANATANAELAYARAEFQSRQSALSRTSAAEGKTTGTREYAESNRPFLGQGTRQKILSQQDQPLTIEQVRDLLNKGK